ncbi:MAG: ATP-binding protein [Gammaproteobacteria bacterium]|nr:ATP-binding protein [Gammaproteobacteria bacterium]
MSKTIEALKDELFRLKSMIYDLPGSIYWKDRNGAYLGRNYYAAELMYRTGLASKIDVASVIGKTDFELFDYETANQYRLSDLEVMNTEKTLIREEILYLQDGEQIVNLSMKRPLYNHKKAVVGIVGNSVDITAQKEAEVLRLTNSLNQEKIKTQRLLAASIAHEIRTPLAAINAQSGIIKSILPTLLEAYQYALESGAVKKPLRTSQFEFLTHIPEELNQTTASANTFIDMLLAKVNLENLKEQNMPLNQLSMKDTLMNAIHLYPLDSFSAAMIQCDYKKTFQFMGDEVLFRHIIFNLLKNAIYFVRSKGKGGSIKIWCEQQQDQNVLHFKDTGMGVSPESLPNIFNSFYTNTRHGTGVGLAFCKMIIESFGGNISCESVQGKYTHFMLCFPKI